MPSIKNVLKGILFAFGPLWISEALLITGYGLWQTSIESIGMIPPLLVILFPFLILPKSSTGKYLVSLIIIILFIPALLISQPIRLFGFHLAGERAQPIIDAIQTYEKQNGKVPERLSDLVPSYLPALPTRIPPMQIVSKPEALGHYPGNHWILKAPAGRGILNWDEFIYLPAQNYEALKEPIERVGKWGYQFE